MSEIKQNNAYDSIIAHSAERYLPGLDWRLVKAQLWQESSLNPDAVSPVGAQGIAQFMPDTWARMVKKMHLPSNVTPFYPSYAIQACCFYMAELYKEWTAKREDADRYALALASYNAGLGNILEAQKLAGDANEYHKIIAQLHRVTNADNANETSAYVEKIFGFFIEQIIRG